MTDELPRMYTDLAPWFHLITRPEDYDEEASIFASVLMREARRPVLDVLELGSGGGNNASHMKARFTMTLTDRSPAMLDVSRRINPECEHVAGDMRDLRLARDFDAVFAHDAVGYITTESDLAAVVATAAAHLRPGGVALFVPDDTTESYRPRATVHGHDAEDGRSIRYLEWARPPVGNTYTVHFAYLIDDGNGVRVDHDEHLIGLFPHATWLRLIGEAGLEAFAVPYEHSAFHADAGHEMFVGRAPTR